MTKDQEKRVQEIEERANAADEGPWAWEAADDSMVMLGHVDADIESKDVLACNRCNSCIERGREKPDKWNRCGWPDKANDTFIAESRADIPWLIALVREKGKEIARLASTIAEDIPYLCDKCAHAVRGKDNMLHGKGGES